VAVGAPATDTLDMTATIYLRLQSSEVRFGRRRTTYVEANAFHGRNQSNRSTGPQVFAAGVHREITRDITENPWFDSLLRFYADDPKQLR